MVELDYVKEHIDEFEEDNFIDSRFTKRFIDFIPVSEWEKFGFRYTGKEELMPKEWTEENVLAQLKKDVEFGYEKAVAERGISSELMAMVVNAWCKILENGLNLDGNDGWYHMEQFTTVAKHYGWSLAEMGGIDMSDGNLSLLYKGGYEDGSRQTCKKILEKLKREYRPVCIDDEDVIHNRAIYKATEIVKAELNEI